VRGRFHRARSPEQRQPVDARQRLRHILPGRTAVTDALDPWAGVEVKTRVNGAIRQTGNTRILFSRSMRDPLHFAYHDARAWRLDRDRHAEGSGPVVAGDVIEVSIDGIGTLRNPVATRA